MGWWLGGTPVRTVGRVVPERVRPQGRALANAAAAVERNRRAAAERAVAEGEADLASVLRLLAAQAA